MTDIVLKDRDGNPVNHPTDTVSLLMSDGTVQKFVNDETVPDPIEVTINPDFSVGDMLVEPDAGTVFSKVTLAQPDNLKPENIPKGMYIAGVGPGEFGGGSGGSMGTGDYLVQVIDYDGTILALNYLNEGDTFTLPDAPTRNGLVFDRWVAPVTITDNTITVPRGGITIGPLYHTESGATEIDIVLTKATGLTFTFLSSRLTGMTSIDWGDGTIDSTLTHTYSDYGEYTIKIYGMTAIAGGSTSGGIVSATSSAPNYTIIEVRFANTVTSIGNYAFQYCYSLTYVALSYSISNISGYVFRCCYRLACITIRNMMYNNSYLFYNCRSLRHIVAPCSVVGSYAIYGCYSLNSLLHKCPSGITSYGLSNNYSLTRIKFVGSVNSIAANTFANNTSVLEYDFTECTKVPTLAETSAFTGINPACKIRVPSSLYSTWIAATNWSTYANYIVAVET